MFKEFGVEPAVFTKFDDARSLFQTLKAEHGRLLAAFPGDWRSSAVQAVREARKLKPVQKAQLESYITGSYKHPYRQAMSGQGWLECVRYRCGGFPLHLVVTARKGDFGAHIEDVLNEACAEWEVAGTLRVPRNVSDILTALSDILSLSNSIALVDPYLSFASNGRRRDFINGFFDLLCQFPRIERCVFHSHADRFENCVNFIKNRKEVPPSVEMYWCEWDKGDLHDRFLVANNVGAVRLGHGVNPLDDPIGQASKPSDFLELSRVDEKRWVELKAEFVSINVLPKRVKCVKVLG